MTSDPSCGRLLLAALQSSPQALSSNALLSKPTRLRACDRHPHHHPPPSAVRDAARPPLNFRIRPSVLSHRFAPPPTRIMDARQSQGPPQRPQDRPFIQNPNHHPNNNTSTTSAPPPHPSYPQYQPPQASQPPVHVPFADPFQRRDPFLPAAPQRRGSYGMSSRDSVGSGWGNNNGRNFRFSGFGMHTADAEHEGRPFAKLGAGRAASGVGTRCLWI